jgi:hypothetical protein
MMKKSLRKWRRVPIALAALLLALAMGATPVRSAVDVEGDATAVQVVARQAQISEVLVALSARFAMRYDTMINLDSVIDGTYRGPLGHVLARVLSGYNYVVSTREGRIEVIVVERVGSPPVAVAPTQTALPPNTNPAAQWRSSIPAVQKP